MPKLLGQDLVKRKNADFGGRIVIRAGDGNKAGGARDRYDMTVVAPDHGRQKFLDGPEVRHDVHLEGSTDLLLGLVDDRATASDTGVVDQNGRVAVVTSDSGCSRLQGLDRGDVGLVKGDAARCGLICQTGG